MISKKEVTFGFVGSVFGINSQVKDFLTQNRKNLRQDKLHVFIFIWDFWENQIWLKNFMDSFQPIHKIEFHVKSIPYNEPDFFDTQQKFMKDVAYKSDTIPSAIGKRLWYWYALNEVMKMAYEYNPDCYIQTIYPDSRVIYSSDTKVADYYHHFFNGTYYHKHIGYPPKIAKMAWDDILFTSDSNDYMIKEEYLLSHIKNFKKILIDFDWKEIQHFLTKCYLQFFKDAGVTKPKNMIELGELWNDTSVVANEASYFLKQLYNPHFDTIGVVRHTYFSKASVAPNPWFNIEKDSINVHSPWKIIPREEDPTVLFWFPSNDKKSKQLQDNVAGFSRKNKK